MWADRNTGEYTPLDAARDYKLVSTDYVVDGRYNDLLGERMLVRSDETVMLRSFLRHALEMLRLPAADAPLPPLAAALSTADLVADEASGSFYVPVAPVPDGRHVQVDAD